VTPRGLKLLFNSKAMGWGKADTSTCVERRPCPLSFTWPGIAQTKCFQTLVSRLLSFCHTAAAPDHRENNIYSHYSTGCSLHFCQCPRKMTARAKSLSIAPVNWASNNILKECLHKCYERKFYLMVCNMINGALCLPADCPKRTSIPDVKAMLWSKYLESSDNIH